MRRGGPGSGWRDNDQTTHRQLCLLFLLTVQAKVAYGFPYLLAMQQPDDALAEYQRKSITKGSLREQRKEMY